MQAAVNTAAPTPPRPLCAHCKSTSCDCSYHEMNVPYYRINDTAIMVNSRLNHYGNIHMCLIYSPLTIIRKHGPTPPPSGTLDRTPPLCHTASHLTKLNYANNTCCVGRHGLRRPRTPTLRITTVLPSSLLANPWLSLGQRVRTQISMKGYKSRARTRKSTQYIPLQRPP